MHEHNNDTNETAHDPVHSSLGSLWYHSLTHRPRASHAGLAWARGSLAGWGRSTPYTSDGPGHFGQAWAEPATGVRGLRRGRRRGALPGVRIDREPVRSGRLAALRHLAGAHRCRERPDCRWRAASSRVVARADRRIALFVLAE